MLVSFTSFDLTLCEQNIFIRQNMFLLGVFIDGVIQTRAVTLSWVRIWTCVWCRILSAGWILKKDELIFTNFYILLETKVIAPILSIYLVMLFRTLIFIYFKYSGTTNFFLQNSSWTMIPSFAFFWLIIQVKIQHLGFNVPMIFGPPTVARRVL